MIKHPDITLQQKYTQLEGQVFLNGTQALVRLPLVQIRRDRLAGLNTAGFISGYRGSPLGSYDMQLTHAQHYLNEHNIVFRAGVNEDLAATAVWGTQQLESSKGANYDGVFGIWYGKGPGVDRSGDVLKHANAAGSAKHGGVLCLAGDDHGAKSSSIPHQSDHDFMSAVIPMLYPSSIHEFIDMGLLGIAMSRYSGCWVGMKLISDSVETSAAIDLSGENKKFIIPKDFEIPEGGLNFRQFEDRWSQDERLQNFKPYAALAFARANQVDRITLDTKQARLGIVASGKAYEDVRQALRELEIDVDQAHELGLRVYKVRMPWPLEPEGIRHFSLGLEEILIIEERREIIENQIKQQLFNWRADVRPRIIGKFDHEDRHVLSLNEELSTGEVARAIADRLLHFDMRDDLKEKIKNKLNWLEQRAAFRKDYVPPINRLPYYCSGCPHNTSTRVISGSRALAGIGCHFMAQWMDRKTSLTTHMGAEGVSWTGLSPFTDEKHVFVNLGDGTFFHSGILAIRQSVASSANMTYKLLYNDAVAMTGGQHVDGYLTPEKLTHQLFHEGVQPIYLLSDEPQLYKLKDLPKNTVVQHRDSIDSVMAKLRDTPGCSAIVFVQTCAAEKRRRRKQKILEDPDHRVFINPAVCEGCGDCSAQSNCISIEPLDSEFGRKRSINQSSCNKDFSCIKGFCPSFISVYGATLKKHTSDFDWQKQQIDAPNINISLDKPYNIVVAGVGGTGVLTIGSIIGMAAHIEGNASLILDMSGLAQKGGQVISHVRLCRHRDKITSPRIVNGKADLLIAADTVVATASDCISLCVNDHTNSIVNTRLSPVGGFVENPDFDFKEQEIIEVIKENTLNSEQFIDFTQIAERLVGDAIATNMLMLGFSYQLGLVPVSHEAIIKAIDLNGVGVSKNINTFHLGRYLATNRKQVTKIINDVKEKKISLEQMSTEQIIQHRYQFLIAYQNKRLADKYQSRLKKIDSLSERFDEKRSLLRATAINYAKLLAYKDEYEVARLYTDPTFTELVNNQFSGDFKIAIHLAPPLIPSKKDDLGRPNKRTFGPWILKTFRVLAKLKFLRSTPLDIFAYHPHRKLERQLIDDYERLIDTILPKLSKNNYQYAVELCSLPEKIRGFGQVKENSIKATQAKQATLLEQFKAKG